MKPKVLIAAAAVVLAAAAAFFWYSMNRVETIVIDADRTVEGDFAVNAGQRVVLANGARLTVTGNLSVDGELACQGGGLLADVGGELRVSRKLSCAEAAETAGIAISAKTFTFDKSATVVSAGSIQLVDRPDKVLVAEQLDAAFDEVEKETGTGLRVGPVVPGNGLQSSLPLRRRVAIGSAELYSLANALLGVESAGAQVGPRVTISGNWQVVGEGEEQPGELDVQRATPKVKKILLNFDFGDNGDVTVQDFTLQGPHGSHGENSYDKCTVLGGRGGDAMRLNVQAANLTINNFNLTLGNGGDGGIARTSKDCERAYATGGDGGKPGNFKMVATGKFQILGTFDVTPGRGGNGGLAEATGKNGEAACPGTKGGDADARGGKGGDSLNVISSSGSVGGLANVVVGDVQAGRGGDAIANAGTGGAGNACGCAGGTGGKATATAGNGGKAVKSGSGWAFAVSEGGDGGDATANGGHGGAGGSCGPDKAGGKGGNGGDSQGKAGTAGTGGDTPGTDGAVLADMGGNGGNGGDGCTAGAGGNRGNGQTPGTPGQPGKTTCKIKVIYVNGKYIYADSVHQAGPDACDANHWHGTGRATDGTIVQDPAPNGCGHCKVADCPVMEVDAVPPYVPAGATPNVTVPSLRGEVRLRL